MQEEVDMTALHLAGRDGGPDVDARSAQVDQLKQALVARDVIGQAKGMLMERYRIDAEEAFVRLRFASQRQNRKLRDLAEELVRTGAWSPP